MRRKFDFSLEKAPEEATSYFPHDRYVLNGFSKFIINSDVLNIIVMDVYVLTC